MSIEINQFNLKSGILNKHKNDVFGNKHWHKIIVENVVGLDREAVLKTIMNFCHPLHFIPVCYESSINTAEFLMKNCGPAIERMFNYNLVIPNPFNKDKAFEISIKICFANGDDLKINIENNALNVLNKRFNQETGVLNLENFAKDEDLEEYCPLSQPKLLYYVLHLARNIHFKSLKLCSNDLENLKPMEVLVHNKELTAIDLRYNNIKNISEISNLRDLKLTELWLDGNPICDNYDEFTYGRTIKQNLETIEKLDGVNVQGKIFLPFRPNFLCSETGYDVVDQFLEHYFSLYDSHNRSILDGIYHQEALLSITCNYIPSQSTSFNAMLSVYKNISRNLHQIPDFAKNMEFLFVGSDQILGVLNSLPVTEHDPFSFTVDLIMYTKKTAILVVGGVFREVSDSLSEGERLLNFTRIFVLLAGPNGEYSIINEMMHISNATTTQAVRAFVHVKLPKPYSIYIPQPQNGKEMNEVAKVLTVVTGMNINWSRKCLEECNYNLDKALRLFVQLFKIDKIPSSAFDSLTEDANIHQKEDIVKKMDIQKILNQPHMYGSGQPVQILNAMALQTRNTQSVTTPTVPTVRNVQPNQPIIMSTPTNVRPTITPTRNFQSMNTVRTIVPVNLPRPVVPVNLPRPVVPLNLPRPVVPVNPLNPLISLNITRPIVPHMKNIIHPTLNLTRPFLRNIHGFIPPRPIIPPNIPDISSVQKASKQLEKKQKNLRGSSLVNIDLKNIMPIIKK